MNISVHVKHFSLSPSELSSWDKFLQEQLWDKVSTIFCPLYTASLYSKRAGPIFSNIAVHSENSVLS